MTQHVELRKNRAGQDRAYIAGTRIRVQDIYAQSEVHGRTPDEIAAAFPQLTLAQIHSALAYYFEHREAIIAELRQDEQFVALIKTRTGPGPLERKLGGEGAGDEVSPR